MVAQNVVVFGAGGNTIGHHVLQALVRDATFSVSVLARESSKTKYPPTVSILRVTEGFRQEDLVETLQHQDVVVSAVGFSAREEQYKLIDAAIEAGVNRFIPSEWGIENGDVRNQELSPVFKSKGEVETYLRSKQTSTFSWTAVATGSWLDCPHCAILAKWYQQISQTTLPYAALATVQLLKHPDIARNRRIFLSPFKASQQQIVAELEKHQVVKYSISHVDTENVIQAAKTRWTSERDQNAAYTLVPAGILLPRFEPNFLTSGKQPILEHMIRMPALTLEDVVREWVAAQVHHTEKRA